MFEHGRVGTLQGADPGHDLLLPEGRPLSYLRVVLFRAIRAIR